MSLTLIAPGREFSFFGRE